MDPMQTPKSTSGTSQQRIRSKTDSALSLNSTLLAADSTSIDLPYRSRLYELFSLIDKEFETLYLENYQLKLRLGQGPDASLNELLKSQSHEQSTLVSKEFTEKLSGKKQNWKTALIRPQNRLVSNLKNSRARIYGGHTDAVLFLASCSHYGRSLVASASADHTARVFCAKTGNCLLQYIGHEFGSVNSISIRPSLDGQFQCLTASGDRTIHLWRTASFGDSNTALISSEDDLDDLDVVSEKLMNEPEEDHFNHVPMVIRQPLRIFTGHTNVVTGAEWLMGGEQIISVSWDQYANIYDVETGNVVTTLSGHEDRINFCASHTTNKLVASASNDCTFRLWDFREAMRSVAIFQGHSSSVNSVVFAGINQLISSSDDRTLKIWDLRNMRSPHAFSRFESSVNKVAASKQHIAVPLDNRNIYVLDLNGNRICRIHRSNGHSALVEAATWIDDVETNNLITCSIDKQIIGWKVQLNNKN